MAAEILIPISLFACIFGIVYLYLTTRNRERMALIEKGADASLFNTGKTIWRGSIIINLAFLAMGIGTGVLIGAGLEMIGMDDEVAFPASIFIFAGLGLYLSFMVNRRWRERDEY
jgi:hypothetical protein